MRRVMVAAGIFVAAGICFAVGLPTSLGADAEPARPAGVKPVPSAASPADSHASKSTTVKRGKDAEVATHAETGLIKVGSSSVNAFCLTREGNLLAACGDGPGEVRVLSPEGKLLATWKLDFKPEAINTASNGDVLVAGQGTLARLSSEGRILRQAQSPHAKALREHEGKLREQAAATVRQLSVGNADELMIAAYEQMVDQLQEKKEKSGLNAQEEQALKLLPVRIEQLKARTKTKETPKNQEELVQQQLDALVKSKSRVASISSDSNHVYVATPSPTGYTFDVWRLTANFEEPVRVVEDLRGCCGQMDVQASDSGIYVAENARHRVACFQPDGKLLEAWGKRDPSGRDGFTSCCNPMNVCFGGGGDVFTAESTTGRIKRFSPQGELKEYVGSVSLVPGCKNVSIAASQDAARVYMLDMTRNHIVIMERNRGADAATPE